MTSLVPFQQPYSPADAVREVARTDAALSVLSDHKSTVKAWLNAHMTALRETAGSDVTVKQGGASAYYSGGNLQLTVTDDGAFAGWLEQGDFAEELEWTERVEADPEGLAWLLDKAEWEQHDVPPDDDVELLIDLTAAIRKVVTRTQVPVFAEGLLDDLLLDATETHLHVRLIEDGDTLTLMDVESGEVVPGLSVSRTSETLTVRGGKLKKAYIEQMKAQLFDGGADALDQGDADG